MRTAVLARADVLGFSKMAVDRKEIYEILNKQRDVVNSGFERIRKAAGIRDAIDVRLYGDTIDMVFGTGTYWDPSLAYQVAESVARLQVDLMREGILVRGAIVHGEILDDSGGKSFTGPAMVTASNLEKCVPGPFVAIDNDVREMILRNIYNEYNSLKDREFEESRFFVSRGGYCLLNFLALGGQNTEIVDTSVHRESVMHVAGEYIRGADQGSTKESGHVEHLIAYYNSICNDERHHIRYEKCGHTIRFLD